MPYFLYNQKLSLGYDAVKITLEYSINIVVMLGVFGVISCTGFERPLREADLSEQVLEKTVSINNFSLIEGQDFNFNELSPTMIHITDGILYCSDGNRDRFFSWDIERGNQKNAWVRLGDFQGREPNACYDLNSGERTITKLGPAPQGVVAALSTDGGGRIDKKLGGIARFDGQNSKASWSKVFSLADAHQSWPSTVLDMEEQRTPDGALVTYAIVELSPVGLLKRRYVLFGASSELSGGFNGIEPSGVDAAAHNHCGAFSRLPDGSMLLAHPKGLVSIAQHNLRAHKNPVIEQKDLNDVINREHPSQWREGLALGARVERIVSMRMVADLYVIIAVDDGKGNTVLSAADITKKPYIFKGNFKAPAKGVFKIVTHYDEARIISPEAIYRFKNGVFALELDSHTIARDKAYVRKSAQKGRKIPFTIKTFKGGNMGDVPDDGTDFYDAAPYRNDWYYATDQGLFKVEKSSVTKAFNYMNWRD